MPTPRVPKITWGASFVNTLNIGYPLDLSPSYHDPRSGFAVVEFPSGVRDAWDSGQRKTLAGTVRWIPTADTADPLATGWDGATGFAAFLDWARAQNKFRFFPDKNSGTFLLCYLLAPMDGEPPLESDATRQVRLVIAAAEDETGDFTGY